MNIYWQYRWYRAVILALVLIVTTLETSAREPIIPLPIINQNISGVAVSFTGELALSQSADNKAMDVGLLISLKDLAGKLTQIIKNSGLEKNDKCGDRISIHSANMTRIDNKLRIKVSGRAGKEVCLRTRIPEIHGLSIKMKTHTVLSSTVDSNISITMIFVPAVEDRGQKLRMKPVGNPTLEVSNDAVRAAISALRLEAKLLAKIKAAVDHALLADKASFSIPRQLKKYSITLRDARIVDYSGSIALAVAGHLPYAELFKK